MMGYVIMIYYITGYQRPVIFDSASS